MPEGFRSAELRTGIIESRFPFGTAAVISAVSSLASGCGSFSDSTCVHLVNPIRFGLGLWVEAIIDLKPQISNLKPEETSGGYCGGVPPLPIPNREVKPACADGTAMQCGRVGGRHLFPDCSPSGLQSFFCLAKSKDFRIFQSGYLVERRNGNRGGSIRDNGSSVKRGILFP